MNVNSNMAMDQPSQSPSFRLKGGLFPLTLLELASGDLQQLRESLSVKVSEAPAFFEQAPAVLSLETLETDETELDLAAIQQLCQEFGVIIVALRGAGEELKAQAKSLNLAIMANSRSKSVSQTDTVHKPVSIEETPAADSKSASQGSTDTHPSVDSSTAETVMVPTKVITTPVRSGQQIYAAGGDLIVLAPVSAGAELLADGNIHVYGAMRGRALAGVKGNTSARVFCQSQEAELISIAGYFKLNEDLRNAHWKQSIQAFLTDETLNIEPLKASAR